MTEWQISSVIIALVTLIMAIVRPIIKLHGSIARLTAAIDGFERMMDRMAQTHEKLCHENKRTHKEFYDRLDGAEKKLDVQAMRIGRLEER